MMLVASRYSGRGLGRRLLTHVLAEAADATVFLCATEYGRPLYEKLGYEATNMIRKGQMHGVGKGDILSQVKFIASLFEVAS